VIAELVMTGVIAGAMLAETRLSVRHERGLRARGAIEPPCDPYTAIAALYPLAFAMMIGEGLYRAAQLDPAATRAGAPSWFASGLVLFFAGKALKYWAIQALGPRWSFRILVLPGAPLVTSGPYRYVAHPNYIGIAGELAGTAMMMKALVTGPIGIVLFGLALWKRIRCEERALGESAPPRRDPRTS
jgi:methyltransferase